MDLLKILDLGEYEFNNEILESILIFSENKVSIEEGKELFKKYDLDIENIKINNYKRKIGIFSPLETFVYFYKNMVFDFSYANDGDLERVLRYLKDLCNDLDLLLDKGEYRNFLYGVSSNYLIGCFNMIADYMSDKDIEEVGRSIYLSSDYGASHIWRDHIERIFKRSNQELKDKIKSDKVVIYRGIGSKSKQLDEEFYSWTLDVNVAKFFATRMRSLESNLEDIKVFKVEIYIDDVMAYIGGGEEEILVMPEDISYYDIKEIEFDKNKNYSYGG